MEYSPSEEAGLCGAYFFYPMMVDNKLVLYSKYIMPPVVKTRKKFSKLSSFPCSKN